MRKPMMLTEKQIQVLRFFRDYKKKHGISPTLEEVAESLGVTKITIYEHLNHLVAKGAVHRDKARARAVAVLHDPDAGPEPVAASPAAPARDLTIPVLGSIAAGRPIEAVEDKEELALTDLIPSDDRHYLLRVKGKSMIEDHIDHGDLVVVERRETAKNGEIVVAIVRNDEGESEEATLKRFYREGSRIRLQPANAEMAPIYPSHCEIRGVVKGVVRRFR